MCFHCSAKDQNTEIAAQIEDEMEQQVAIMEERIRQEEQEKLNQQKQEAHAQLQKANDELGDMEHKIIAVSCLFIYSIPYPYPLRNQVTFSSQRISRLSAKVESTGPFHKFVLHSVTNC